jgi:hypothetical protein
VATLARIEVCGSGYRSSFYHKYHGQHSLICQSIMNNECIIDIKKIDTYIGKSPIDVWTKLNNLTAKNYLSCDQLVAILQNHVTE